LGGPRSKREGNAAQANGLLAVGKSFSPSFYKIRNGKVKVALNRKVIGKLGEGKGKQGKIDCPFRRRPKRERNTASHGKSGGIRFSPDATGTIDPVVSGKET